MNEMAPAPGQGNEKKLEPLIGLAQLMRMTYGHSDLAPLTQRLIERSQCDLNDANALMDLATLMHLTGHADIGLSLQRYALEIQPNYRLPTAREAVKIRVLALVAPGDLMANTPVEFLLVGADIALDLFYLFPGQVLPAALPEHDLLFVAIGESDENLLLLRALDAVLDDWHCPVLNHSRYIAGLARDTVCRLLSDAPGILMPPSVRTSREVLEEVGLEKRPLAEILPDEGFPIIVRPIDSHAGQGLARLDHPAAIVDYLAASGQTEFYVSPFIDYSDTDGLFRKYRIALINGQPFICHMGISEHWMIHYANAGMEHSASKREEEALVMARFDEEFALRHALALQAIASRVGLNYVAVDCAQTRNGKLLIFEVDTAVIVHDLDSREVFPYKKPTMQKLFAAFRQMLFDSLPTNRS